MEESTPSEESAVPPGAFCKYDKMAEDSGSVGVVLGGGQYIVTEKVHGANFCIIAAGTEGGLADVSFAKRTAPIGRARDAEDFYSCRSSGLLAALERPAREVFGTLAGTHAAAAVHIYGELFGGRYSHPEVPPTPGVEPVQVGIWYAPDLRFMAFDVAVEAPGGARHFLDFAAARVLCEGCGLFFAVPLFEGPLGECVSFPIEFKTTIPGRLGLPPLPEGVDGGENLAEGVVVRPQHEPPQRGAGGGRKESARGLFKRKIAAFSEKRYQNDDWKKGKAGGTGHVAVALSSFDEARYEILACITEQRLAAVMSKVGRVEASDRAACRQLLEDFKQDVRESLGEAEAQALQQSAELQEELDRLSRELITTELLGRRAGGQSGTAA